MLNKAIFSNIKSKAENKLGKDFSEKLYLISLFLILIFFNVTSTTFDIHSVAYLPQICSLCRYFLLLVIALKAAFLSDYTLKDFIIMAAVSLALLTGAYLTKENALLFSFILIIGAKNCDIKKIAKIYFYTYIGIILLVFALHFMGFLPEFGMYRGDSARFALGFNHPNLLGRLILVIIISGLIIYKDKLNIKHLAAFALLTVFVYAVPQCRSVFLCLICLFILLMMQHFGALDNKIMKGLLISAIPLFAVISLSAAMAYKPESSLWQLLDRFSSSRIYFSNEAYKLFGYTSVLGQNIIPYLNDTTLIIDNCYIRLIVEFGIIALYLFCHFNAAITKKALDNKRFDIAVIVVIMGLFGIFELHTYVAVYNLALFCFTAKID